MAKLRNNKKAEEVEVEEVEVVEVVKDEPVKTSKKGKKVKEDEIPVIDNAVKKAEEVELVEETKTEPTVRVCTNRDVRTYIGAQWYNLKAGKQASVPKTVKEKLRKAGYLSAL